jgi:uncharacterized membrane protein
LEQSSAEAGKDLKQNFQVERLAFFSDAIFAIAITLLVIEFKPPAVTKSSTFASTLEALLSLKFNLFSLMVSFTLISKYWIRHHFLFRHIHNYNKQLVIANLMILLPIIFFPFTTTFFGESIGNDSVVILALRIFLLNHILAGLTIYFFYWLSVIKYPNCSFPMAEKDKLKFKFDNVFLTIVFIGILVTTILTNNRTVILWTIIISLLSKRVIYLLLKRTTNGTFHPKEKKIS